MAVKPSGSLSMKTDIVGEFGGAAPHGLKEYYNAATGIPASGTISMSDFYGKSSLFTFTLSSNQENWDLRSAAITAGWDGSAPLIANINSGVYVWSDTTATAGLIISGSFAGGLTLNNSGYIIGKGGQGGGRGNNAATSGLPGGPALSVSSTGVTIVNSSGAYIAGGGGGGAGSEDEASRYGGGGGGAGGGAGGGVGQIGAGGGAAGGAIGSTGADAADFVSDDDGNISTYLGGHGGGAGGGGGIGDGDGGNRGSTGGGGGGRILPGVGGDAGGIYSAGGSAGNAGEGGSGYYAGGGGGWGANGGNSQDASGGAGGAAISGSGYTVTGTTSQIYGSY